MKEKVAARAAAMLKVCLVMFAEFVLYAGLEMRQDARTAAVRRQCDAVVERWWPRGPDV